ncbi:MAG: GNAT family N-acetyltransferase [Candidatus Riflebacteria bacterium]|nr:GNAT family N-acetyltransferase [Candidatus Riflebacteria bacterium]
MNIIIKHLVTRDYPWVSKMLNQHWGSSKIAVHGELIAADQLPGLIAYVDETPAGLLTYRISEGNLEIVTLNSFIPDIGIGTALISKIKEIALQKPILRIWLITTNDNLEALGFYQKKGFVLVQIHRNAVAQSRILKPSIPLSGNHNLPIRDEIELEFCIHDPPHNSP